MSSLFPCKYQGCSTSAASPYAISKHQERCSFRISNNDNPPIHLFTPHTQDLQQQPTPSPLLLTTPPLELEPDSPSFSTKSKLLLQSLAMSFAAINRKLGSNVMDEIFTILQDEDFSLPLFLASFPSSKSCSSLVSSLTDIHFAEHGFSSSRISDSSGTYSGLLYHRDPIQALIRQIVKANSENCLFLHTQQTDTDQTQLISHPMHTSLALRVQKYIRERVMGSENDSVIWNDNDPSLPLSFVGQLQLFSDKTCTTLKAFAIVAYPVHLTLLYFSLPFRVL